ncbi:hypothetical protein BU26DRAFT_104166 [Trematosphaeria pertusa]|uniref:Uncharacterized protein n=1 Tax=Trematosphaeria pertusa TaxID=390896 RepID=A0A6A6I3D5_9PLEO|nr:uncharacterized protein BU26DRAFT_104166 [Trematosphaeria pertusa]KAF2244508.1 hypothetical protein BU26DRAFT_104166 [Trematosphaeria pertusa]
MLSVFFPGNLFMRPPVVTLVSPKGCACRFLLLLSAIKNTNHRRLAPLGVLSQHAALVAPRAPASRIPFHSSGQHQTLRPGTRFQSLSLPTAQSVRRQKRLRPFSRNVLEDRDCSRPACGRDSTRRASYRGESLIKAKHLSTPRPEAVHPDTWELIDDSPCCRRRIGGDRRDRHGSI